MTRPNVMLVAGAVALACLWAGALPALSLVNPPADSMALTILQRMASTLRSANTYRFVADTTMDEVGEGGESVQYSNQVTVILQKPHQLFAHVRGDLHNLDLWYDGRTLTKYEARDRTTSTLPVQGTVEKMLDTLAEKYDVTFPLADFLVQDVYRDLTGSVKSGRYLGIHVVNGEPCHHLAFTQDNIDWQIWIAAGKQPLPRKFVITYKTLPEHPQYTAMFSSWDLAPVLPRGTFTPVIPQGTPTVPFRIGAEAGHETRKSELYR